MATTTLAKCFDLRPLDVTGVLIAGTKARALEVARTHPAAQGMTPCRARGHVGWFWILAEIMGWNETTVTLRCLREDGSTLTAELGRPEAVDLPMLTAEQAARHVGKRVGLRHRSGERVDATILGVDEAYVIVRRHDKRGRIARMHMAGLTLCSPVHQVQYSQGVEEVAGTEYYAPDGRLMRYFSMTYSAWCSCRRWRHHGSSDSERRFAVQHHLAETAA